MNLLGKVLTTSAITLMATSSIAFADTTATATTTASNAAQTRFVALYEANQQTEATLLSQAQKVQDTNSAQYANFINTVQSQVSSLYTSETTLAALKLTLTKTSDSNTELRTQELALEKQLKSRIATAQGRRGTAERQLVQKLRNQLSTLNKEIGRLNVEIKKASGQKNTADAQAYASHIASLRQTILGLQADEIRVTKMWIASGQSTTGSVYGN